MERRSQARFAALGRTEQKLEVVFSLQERLLSSIASSHFIFTFRKVLKFGQRKASPCSADKGWSLPPSALFCGRRPPSQHGLWVEEAEGCSASPGFPGTPWLGKQPCQ